MGERIANHRCQVCRHPERWRVELLRAGGASLDALADKFSLDRDAIWRHWTKHVSPEMKASYGCEWPHLYDLEDPECEHTKPWEFFLHRTLVRSLEAIAV
ncbi:hypothetical protein [Bradyrhizobium iriomotense]|uniref:Helix-turn-helix domain-containing protein n=1 Tax=Bradyrhizobium iriomotense TaxID=441950 RepID=A0ABQ6BAF7_9BRAD|nr:hypothetical protein [Bradyrhizobium iriomotense]GLR91362.1 hypothetical protein GCM10007857_80790 [Bradyrhizobium iriomotense]